VICLLQSSKCFDWGSRFISLAALIVSLAVIPVHVQGGKVLDNFGIVRKRW
jgi:hypothetical protein